MTAVEQLRALVKEATAGPWERRLFVAGTFADAELAALAPQLAELVADMRDALVSVPGHGALPLPRAVLARLDALFEVQSVEAQ